MVSTVDSAVMKLHVSTGGKLTNKLWHCWWSQGFLFILIDLWNNAVSYFAFYAVLLNHVIFSANHRMDLVEGPAIVIWAQPYLFQPFENGISKPAEKG